MVGDLILLFVLGD